MSRYQYFKKVVAAPTLDKTGLAFNFPGMKTGEVWIALVTFLYVDFFGEARSMPCRCVVAATLP